MSVKPTEPEYFILERTKHFSAGKSNAVLPKGDCSILQCGGKKEIHLENNIYSTSELHEVEYNTLQFVKDDEKKSVEQEMKYDCLKINTSSEENYSTMAPSVKHSTLQLVKDNTCSEMLSPVPDARSEPKITSTKLYAMIFVAIAVISIFIMILIAALIVTSTNLIQKQKAIEGMNEVISSNDILASQLKQQVSMLKKGLKCGPYNTTSSIPAKSCRALPKRSPSGYYWVASSNHSAIRVYCDMTRTCGSITGGWMRVVSIDMNQTSSECPVGMCLNPGPVRACTRCFVSKEHKFQVGVTYSKVCGRIIGYVSGTPRAFSPDFDIIIVGIVLSYGSPDVNIWSFAAAVDQSQTRSLCPCTSGDYSVVPKFTGDHYFCETVPKKTSIAAVSFDTPLWDGIGCKGSDVCCSFNNPPWFFRELPAPTSENIKMKINFDESKENIMIAKIDIYVQ